MNSLNFVVAVTMPTVTQNEGFLWFYPMYYPFWLQSFYVIGGWYWVYVICFYNSIWTNKKWNEAVFNWVNEVSLWGYLSHYLWIVLVVVCIVRPLNLSLGEAIVLNFSLTLILINLSWWLMKKLCFKKKQIKVGRNEENSKESEE